MFIIKSKKSGLPVSGLLFSDLNPIKFEHVKQAQIFKAVFQEILLVSGLFDDLVIFKEGSSDD